MRHCELCAAMCVKIILFPARQFRKFSGIVRSIVCGNVRSQLCTAMRAHKDMGGSQRDNDSSPNLSFSDLKQKEIEIKEGSARVLWYETQLLIGQPNGGSPKLSKYQRG